VKIRAVIRNILSYRLEHTHNREIEAEIFGYNQSPLAQVILENIEKRNSDCYRD
jgi:hypothetical protein